jgi:hypothetical protein
MEQVAKPRERPQFYIKTNTGSLDLQVSFLGFYDDGGVQEYFALRTNPNELLATPPFDFDRLTKLIMMLHATDAPGGFGTTGSFSIKQQLPVSLDYEDDLPVQTTLLPNYPNPFNPTTNISFQLRESGQTRLEVFDVLGRSVALLANTSLRAGSHTFSFDGAGLSTGTYLVRLTATDGVFNSKIMLVK